MKKVFTALVLLLPASIIAQTADSLFIRQEASGAWYARYRVGIERSIFAVAKKFGVPAATVADMNALSYAENLSAGKLLKIPLTLANWYNYMPPASSSVAALYYRVPEERLDWKDLAVRFNVSKRQLREWNVVDEPDAGTVLAVGWISLGTPAANDVGAGRPEELLPPPTQYLDTIVAMDAIPAPPPLTPMEELYQDQTAGGTMVATEKGAAAFFPATGGTAKGVHYAFHNGASRGSIVRVHNPGTGRTVYVKVLGPMPRTKQYAGAIIGISAAAKAELGVRGDARAWCEVSYAGY